MYKKHLVLLLVFISFKLVSQDLINQSYKIDPYLKMDPMIDLFSTQFIKNEKIKSIYIYEDYEHLKEQYFYHKSGLLQKKITHNEFKDNYVTYYSYNEKGFLIDIDYNGRNFTSLLTGAYVSDRSAYSVLYKYPHQESNICQEKITFINDTVKITQTKYLYDTNGNLVRKTIESFRKDNFSNIEEFYYTYSPTNLIIEIKKYYDRIESPTVTYNYEYFD